MSNAHCEIFIKFRMQRVKNCLREHPFPGNTNWKWFGSAMSFHWGRGKAHVKCYRIALGFHRSFVAAVHIVLRIFNYTLLIGIINNNKMINYYNWLVKVEGSLYTVINEFYQALIFPRNIWTISSTAIHWINSKKLFYKTINVIFL